MQILSVLVIIAAGLALAFAAFNFFGIKKMPEGTEKMSEIAAAIRCVENRHDRTNSQQVYFVPADFRFCRSDCLLYRHRQPAVQEKDV